MRGIIWFKKDLRTHDNPALFYASQQCSNGVVAVYIIDLPMWKKNNVSAIQIEFILRGLEALKHDLVKIQIPLLIIHAKNTADIPQALYTLATQVKADKLFFNQELEINEARRDEAVSLFFAKHNISTKTYNEQLILPYSAVRTKAGEYFKVFTAFKREWLKVFNPVKLLPQPQAYAKPNIIASANVPKTLPDIDSKIDPTLWPAGEKIARNQLNQFIKKNLFSYDKLRDFPALTATSQLSPYLAVGMISARTCFNTALEANAFELDTGNKGALTWMTELIWREFYRHVLISTPRVCMDKAYKLTTEKLPWRYDKHLLQEWQQGNTGFPIVDAAMRQLNTTGWMHNRLRMIVAMFLSKNLFLDWRLGETYFATHLIDYDFASNNGGWQWSASTGTDAVPYFRIFNPTTQSERFDPEGQFIRQYCPELAEFDQHSIHAPHQRLPLLAAKINYPKPIIDYAKSRQQALAAFKKLS